MLNLSRCFGRIVQKILLMILNISQAQTHQVMRIPMKKVLIWKFKSLAGIFDSCDHVAFFCELLDFHEVAQKSNIGWKPWKKKSTWLTRIKLGSSWLYPTKKCHSLEVDLQDNVQRGCFVKKKKYEARLIAKWYPQQPAIDFNKSFAPVVRIDTIWAALAIAVWRAKYSMFINRKRTGNCKIEHVKVEFHEDQLNR